MRNTLFFLLVPLAACSPRLTVTSEPSEAPVFYRTQNSQEKVRLGVTPFEITTREIQEKTKVDAASADYFELIVEKPGFEAQRLMVPSSRFGATQTKVFAKLVAEPPAAEKSNEAHKMVQHLFNAQQFAQKADFDRAQAEVESALRIDGKFTRAVSMRGTIYYLQKNYLESLKWYEKALEIDPQYQEAVKMIAQIRQRIGEKGSTR